MINLLRVAAFVFALSFGLKALAKVSVSSKTLKEASHFELGSIKNWTYEVSRSQKGNGLVVAVQFKGVSADELQSLENFRDKRVSQVIVKEGLNKEALVEFYIENGLNFFDYQTEGQVFGQGAGGQILVFDVYTETKPKVAQKPIDSLVKKNINSFVQNKKENKNAVRGIASVDKPALGQQPALLSSDKNTKEEQKYNVIDVVDKDYKRFAFEGNANTHAAIVRSEEQIYPPFPELVRGIYPQLSDLESNKLNFEVEPTKDTENQTVRLIIKLFKEEKYLLSLKTQKFFREKYPTSKYDETLNLLTAEIHYRLWKKEKNSVDLEAAVSGFKEHLIKYPESQYKFKLNYFVGLLYLQNNQYIEALNHFLSVAKSQQDNPYFWPMKMAIAECYRQLHQEDSALETLGQIEKETKQQNLSVQARFRRGDVYFREKKYSKALEEYSQAQKIYPKEEQESVNSYFNTAEILFRQKDYKKSLAEFRSFLKRFPESESAHFAMNRIATLLEILGAPETQVLGAYLESYYRYRGTPGAYLSKLKINSMRFATMKDKEFQAAIKEMSDEIPAGKVEDMQTLVKLSLADGYYSRGDFDQSFDIYSKFYKEDINSPYLPLFKSRILKVFSERLKKSTEGKKYISTIQLYFKNKDSWLKDDNRVDNKYYLGLAYEKLGLPAEATRFYEAALNDISAMTEDQNFKRSIFEKKISKEMLSLRLAKGYLSQDNIKKASDELDKIKSDQTLSGDEKIEYSQTLAAVSEKQARYDLAISQLKKVVDQWVGQPQDLFSSWMKIAQLNELKKNPEEALKWAQKMMLNVGEGPLTSQMVDSLSYAADLYYRSGNKEEGVKIYRLILDKSTSLQYSRAPLKYKLGKIYFDQNKIKDAEKIWSELKQENGAELWLKMANENLAQVKWSDKLKRYVGRQPASGGKK